MEEIWKDVVGYEGLYQVSNLGRVKSVKHYVPTKAGAKRLSPSKVRINEFDGKYYHVILYKSGKRKVCLVHRLVAEAFIQNKDNKATVNHKDGNKLNNFVYVNPDGSIDQEKSNLEWCTNSENLKHAFKTGLATPQTTHYRGVKAFRISDNSFVGEFYSQHEAARLLGLNVAHICSVLHGRVKQTKGYYFKYNNKEKLQKKI